MDYRGGYCRCGRVHHGFRPVRHIVQNKGLDYDEPKDKVLRFAETTGVSYPLGLDTKAGIFQKYARPDAGVTRNVLIDRNGQIVMLTRLYNETEFSQLVKKIDELMKK